MQTLFDMEPYRRPPSYFGLYNILYVDPPWSYRDTRNDGQRGATHKYPVMTLAELMALPVYRLCAPDCALFMWMVPTQLAEGIALMNAWGFRLVNKALCWVKLYPGRDPERVRPEDVFGGTGHYIRGNTEDCYMGLRGGTMPIADTFVKQVIHAPLARHSAKPPEARDRIVRLYGDLPRIEIFARDCVPGWDAIGYDVGTGDIRVTLSEWPERRNYTRLWLPPTLSPAAARAPSINGNDVRL